VGRIIREVSVLSYPRISVESADQRTGRPEWVSTSHRLMRVGRTTTSAGSAFRSAGSDRFTACLSGTEANSSEQNESTVRAGGRPGPGHLTWANKVEHHSYVVQLFHICYCLRQVPR